MKKKEYIVPFSKVAKARLPVVSEMSLAVWRLFIDIRIPRKVDEFYQDPATLDYHFVTYEG